MEPDTPPSQPFICPVCADDRISPWMQVCDYFLTGEYFGIMQCDACSHRFTVPQPSPEVIGKYYETSKYLSHTDEGKDFTGRLYRLIRGINLQRKYALVHHFKQGTSILDIGCGTGHLLGFFRKQGWKTTGIEPAAMPRQFARDHLKLDVHDEPELANLPGGSFSVVSMWHVLEHVPNPSQRLKEVHRLTAPDGIAVIALPNPDAFDACYYGQYWAAWDVPRHLHHFSTRSFNWLATQAGFELIAVKPMKFDAYYVSLLSEQYRSAHQRYLRAAWKGLQSNLKARRSGNFSSLVYILRKK
ncbi:MAG TPA: class I SAM-dependent methyltransferase [Bacteroidales bacterium]|nr:class I SAM-dependent methyltransferase [Bacteroidales bacterium]HRZ49689.1 class I SAM-dependent methyltransferase [Bacteroidales bacterium]